MPIYEYRCPSCAKKWSKVWSRFPSREEEAELKCRSCGSARLQRLFSPFSKPKSEEQRLESLAGGSSLAGLDENDPRSLARLMRKVSEETGERLEGEEAEMLERMEAGEMPEEEGATGEEAGGDDFL